MFDYTGAMSSPPLESAYRLLSEALDAVAAASGSAAPDDDVLAALTVCEGFTRRLDHLSVTRIADLVRRGTFTDRGYRRPAAALSDLLGWERARAGRRVRVAEQIAPRVGLDGQPLPPRFAATAQVFADAATSLSHVEAIIRELSTPAACRLAPQVG